MVGSSVRGSGLMVALLLATAVAGCDTVGRTSSGPRVAVLEDDKAGTSSINIESLSDVIQRNPNDASAYNTRGAAYARVGRYGDAVNDFNKAIQVDPGNAPAYTNRALAFRQTNRNDARDGGFLESDPERSELRRGLYRACEPRTHAGQLRHRADRPHPGDPPHAGIRRGVARARASCTSAWPATARPSSISMPRSTATRSWRRPTRRAAKA